MEGPSRQLETQSATPVTSKWRKMIPSLTSFASRTAKQSAETTSEAAKTAASKVSGKVNNSIRDFKSYAKESSAQYASEIRSSMKNVSARVAASATHNVQKTGDRMRETILNTAQSTREKLKNEISQKIPKFSLPFMRRLPPSAKTTPEKRSKSISNNTKEAFESVTQSTSKAATFATKVLTESTTNAASNMTSQVQQSVTKASRWLWWWGLAAVAVYGMSTTLTKEGMQVLKDMLNSPKSDSAVNDSATTCVSASIRPSASERAQDERGDDAASKLSWFSSLRGYFSDNTSSD
eukprot:CCRYP_017964-RA/>CCRYP_017964-RA protein AED:0.36 eAED:0.36 QI:0/-1/0/1/-1/1/1/0/293